MAMVVSVTDELHSDKQKLVIKTAHCLQNK